MNNPLQIEFSELQQNELPEHIHSTDFPGLFLIQRPVYSDERGDFWEAVRVPDLEKALQRPFKVLQINRSRNVQKGALRGIHVANWDKLIIVDRGSAFIALVDLRKNSPTYGKVYTDTIGDGHKAVSIVIPAGFGNSYQALVDKTDYIYAVTDLWSTGSENGIRWDDPALSIQWPIMPPILSPKDQVNPTLSDLIPDFGSLRR